MTDLPDILRTRLPAKGDTVVHLDHGLCRLGPVRRMELSDGVVETVELRFRKSRRTSSNTNDTLAVPLSDAVRIWNYGASVPRSGLDRLGTTDWAERRDAAVAELQESLAELRDRRTARDAAIRPSIDISDAHLSRAGEGFAHELTDDQRAALSDIVSDLAAPRPMDRLLIGDVGCGKTEVAVRAALALALTGGRVRLVAPTRVLARQHHDDIAERARELGLETALYSGDGTPAEREAIRERAGEIDILVGTKGVLGDGFDGFALTILDEEQKFGADAKRVPGNALRLSATPIPRTLAEAKVGLADLSLISEYPKGRGRTVTSSLDDTDAGVADLIAGELAKQGRVLVLCPRIRDLKRTRKRLRALLPDAAIGRVHGRRKARRNREAIAAFRDGRMDVLVATSMLETGINVPGANLMLVFGPHRFGLGQLHQLRGRVGRGPQDARFVMVQGKKGTKRFRRRRRALEQMDARGDGLRLAVADATLRGTGRIGEDAQSGHACALGLELFEHLIDTGATRLDSAVPEASGQWEWGFDGKLDTALVQSRAALSDPLACLEAGACAPYPTLISTARALGAARAAIGPKGVVFTYEGGEKLACDADMAEIAEMGAAAVGRKASRKAA